MERPMKPTVFALPLPALRRRLLPAMAIGAMLVALNLGASPASAQNIWIGGTGLWNNSANWSTGSNPGNTDDVLVDNGDAGTNSVVTQDITATINSLTIDAGDTLSANNDIDLFILGTSITNNGTWSLNSNGNFTDFRFADGATLAGTGELVLSDNINNRIPGIAGNNTLTHGADHTIRGAGQLLVNFGNMVNNGTIIADQANNALVVAPRTSFTNNGTLRATGAGGMVLQDGSFTNTNGSIEALTGSSVTISGSTTVVTGGTLSTAGSGVINLQSDATLADLAIAGSVQQANDADARIQGTITNNGTWSLNSNGSFTDLRFADGATLAGTGELVLSDNINNRIPGIAGNDTLTHGADHTIRGAGQLLVSFGNMVNNGTIIADQATNALVIDPGSNFTNNGTLRANGAGGMVLENSSALVNGFINTNGSIEALTGSYVMINATTVTGGTLSTAGSGVINLQGNATLADLAIAGSVQQVNDADARIQGTITNNGTWSLNSIGNFTDLSFADGATLAGTGEFVLSDNINNRVLGIASTDTVTHGADHTIRGGLRPAQVAWFWKMRVLW